MKKNQTPEQFLQNAVDHIGDGSIWLSINRQYTFSDTEWESRQDAMDLINKIIVEGV